jgi:Carboxypeptidase regulatory-like domain
MLHDTDARIKEWAAGVLGGVEVSLAPPANATTGEGASLYLLEICAQPPASGPRRPPLQFAARYLVTTWASREEDAHHMLGALAVSAMETPDLDLEIEPVPGATWAALGATPRPSFFLRLTVRVERPETPAPPVRRPLVLQSAPITVLHGLVLGPDDVPIAGARVELPALGLRGRTDAWGRFRFPAVPAGPRHVTVRVVARGGKTTTAEVMSPATAIEPLLIHIDPLGE